jgi:phosphohistidine phosphatase
MITLSLFRHAKSSWDDPSLEDFDRPLSARGLKAAPRMGKLMQEKGIKPDLVLCSPARRTRETLSLIADAIGNPPTDYPRALYLSPPEVLLETIRKTTSGVSHLMLIGHNPGLQSLAVELCGQGPEEDLEALSTKFATAGLAVITFKSGSWEDVASRSGCLTLYISPKRLP